MGFTCESVLCNVFLRPGSWPLQGLILTSLIIACTLCALYCRDSCGSSSLEEARCGPP